MTPDTNILFITADQWRGDCLGAAGHPVVRTPNLDGLARGGVSFRRHFAQAAPCGPSRAALYTGMYLMNHRSVLNGTPLDGRHDNVALLARRLGYEPALFGYTDTSIDPRTCAPGDPRLFRYEGVLPGFDPVCHLPEGEPRAWLEWMRAGGIEVPDDWRSFVDRPAPGSRWRTQYDAKHSQTAFLTDRFLEWAGTQAAARRGWFAHVSFLRPHPPFLAPAPYDTMFAPESVPAPVRAASRAQEGAQHPLLGVMIDHPFLKSPDDPQEQRELQATYYGMMAEVDDQIARVLDWLDTTRQSERTLVVFTSDHGENLGDHYLLHKLGWFDQSYHVPLIVRGPGVTAGRVVDAFTEHVDVLPTICELLGTAVPLQCDGRALTPWLRGAAVDDWRADTHFEFDFRDPDSPLIEEAFGLTLEECALAVLRDDHGKYVQFSGFPVLPSIFFDLDDDPAQLRNVADEAAYATTVLGYAQRMLAWRMQHTERTLTGMKLTMHAGLVERNATRR
ncbi:MAG TPA: alkaline phosphatase family protein [Acidimicrobiia bacterium]|nr:alkaline phosphatase family protein [Acidimicrobiia bacterium]